jgi:hypothetical protein
MFRAHDQVHSFIPLSLTLQNTLLTPTHIYSHVDLLSVVSKKSAMSGLGATGATIVD